MDSEKRSIALAGFGALAVSMVAYMAYQAGMTEGESAQTGDISDAEGDAPCLTDKYTE